MEERAQNCKKAIAACGEALKVYTLDRLPMQYGLTIEDVGIVYETLAEGQDSAGNLRKAHGLYTEALGVFKREKMTYNVQKVERSLERLRKAHGNVLTPK